MLDLPASTIVNRFVPKEKFYTKTNINTKLRQQFTEEVDKIRWTHKLSPQTLNITSDDYLELQVFEISLKGNIISQSVLRHIDTFIPHPILFIIKKQGAEKAVLAFKQSATKSDVQMKVEQLYETPWTTALDLHLQGRSVEEIYRNYLYQIAPQLQSDTYLDTKTAIDNDSRRQKIVKQIATLNKSIASEISIAKKQEMARERYRLEQTL